MLRPVRPASPADPVYDADLQGWGGFGKHVAKERYGFELVTRDGGKTRYFKTADQIADATRSHSASLYVIEVGGYSDKDPKTGKARTGGVSHMALLHNGTVYESRMQAGTSCVDRPLKEFMSGRSLVYLFGPK